MMICVFILLSSLNNILANVGNQAYPVDLFFLMISKALLYACLMTTTMFFVAAPSGNSQSQRWRAGSGSSQESQEKERKSNGLFKNLFKPKAKTPEPVVETPKVAAPSQSFGSMNSLPPVAREPGKRRVFVLTDSQGFTEFGPKTCEILSANGFEVVLHAVKNGSPYYWSGMWKSPVLNRIYGTSGRYQQAYLPPFRISDYVREYDPDIFIIQAGTNIDRDLVNSQGVRTLVAKCASAAAEGGALVLWIGPPDAQDDIKSPDFQSKAVAQLRASLGELSQKQGFDCFFDSLASSTMPNSPRIGDGEHPGPTTSRGWATAACEWSLPHITSYRRTGVARKANRPSGDANSTAPSENEPDPFEQAMAGFNPKAFPSVKLRLVEKSRHVDLKTFNYTDSFTVYKYEVLNTPAVVTKFPDYAFASAEAEGGASKAFAYVMHWTVHKQSEDRPAFTPLAGIKENTTFELRLLPREQHPLKSVLRTMSVRNDYDDFEADVFVSTELLDERFGLP